MKLSIIATSLFATLSYADQWYPLDRSGEVPKTITPYTYGENVLIDCIARNIDNGEHKFDDKERIIYTPFPVCSETGKPLAFKYGVSEDINCTIAFSDELYHLFQLYMHEDVPFSCRLPLSSELNSLEKGNPYIPLTFNFRGEIHESHLDIDSSLNVLLTKPNNQKPEEFTFVSAIAYSAGTYATNVRIGTDLTLSLAVRWFDQIPNSNSPPQDPELSYPFDGGFYKFPLNFIPISYTTLYTYLGLVAALSSAIAFTVSYISFSKKARSHGHYKVVDTESAYGKLD